MTKFFNQRFGLGLFNHHRLLEPIGYIPPAEFEANYYRQLADQAASVA